MHTYTQYWQLTRSPFAGQATAEDFYPTAITEEAIARVQFLVDNGRRLGFLLGGPGTGKSLLIDLLSERAAESGMELLRFNLLGLREEEFVCKLAGQLRCLTSEDASYAVQWARIGDRLAANRYQGLSTVVLLDDADQARDDVMPALTRLVLSEQHPAARMTVVLTAQAQRVGRLGPKLNDLCDLRIDLQPWSPSETRAYLQQAPQRVGGSGEVFSVDAADRLHELSHGVPRRLRQLAELSLVAGASERVKQISPEIVEAVHRSLTSVGLSETGFSDAA